MDISGQHFLVVGASGALGSLVARALAGRGARVTLAGRSEQALAAVGIDGATLLTGDLTMPDVPRTFVEGAAAVAPLNGVINAAGIVAFGPTAEVDDDTVDDIVLVDFLAPLRLVRSALTTVTEGGVILNISAVVAEKAMPNMGVYSASKAAVSALLTSVRPEARRKKIRIVDVRPPHTETGLATRAIAGDPPRLPQGLDPAAVAERIVAAVAGDETDVPSTAFA